MDKISLRTGHQTALLSMISEARQSTIEQMNERARERESEGAIALAVQENEQAKERLAQFLRPNHRPLKTIVQRRVEADVPSLAAKRNMVGNTICQNVGAMTVVRRVPMAFHAGFMASLLFAGMQKIKS